MTDSSGGAASRLSAALDDILRLGRRAPADVAPDAGTAQPEPRSAAGEASGSVEQRDEHGRSAVPAGADEPYELPEIVPATDDPAVAPQLPSRPAHVRPAVVPAVGPPPAAPSAAGAPASAAAPAAPRVAPPSTPSTGWGDLVPIPAARPTAQLRAPGRRPRVRRVTRVVRHVDPWSVFKVSLIFSVVAYLVVLTSGVLLWRVADSTGTLANVERWFTQFGWETFELKGDEIFANAWVIGLFLAVGLTGTAVLMATLFNLVSDIVGGVRVTVLEEEVVERTASSSRRYVVRRPPLAEGSAPESAQWEVDDDEAVGPPPAVTQPSPSPHAATAATRRATTGSTDWSVDD